ncbi:MAG: hypothetical protein RL141_913 [Candidatus Parcubacteria bacterium]|jgi:aspartate aminotransferase/aminotransferase
MTLPIGHLTQSIHPALSVKYNMRVYDLQKQGKDIINLSLGEAFFTMPPLDFEGMDVAKGYHYSSSRGLAELRQVISARYASAYGVPSDPEREVLVTAGSKAVIYMTLFMIVEPGDDVIVLEPAWVSYEEQIRLCRANPVMVPYTASIDTLEAHLTPRTKAIILNNPNNPSGHIYSKEELKALMNLAERRGLFIISDEAYSDFTPPEEPFTSIGVFDPGKERTFIVNSLSKSLGLSGWRIGYVIAHTDYIEQLLKLNIHLITCPATLLEQYLAHHFDRLVDNARTQIVPLLEKRAWAVQAMKDLGLEHLPGSGTFYFMVSVKDSGFSSSAFAESLLEEQLVSTVPGIGYGASVGDFLRISIGAEPRERLAKGFQAIRDKIHQSS